jgi:hypothetical protein
MQIQRVLLNLKAVSTGAFDPPAPLFRFVAAALVGPFILLTIGGRQSNNLPWSFWTTMLLMLLAVICVGFLRFTSDSRGAADISISPDRRSLSRSK